MVEPKRKLDEYGPEEMAIPEWKMVQKVGADWAKGLGANPGQFYNTVTEEIADDLNLIVVDIRMGRTKWGNEITDAGPVCACPDAKENISIYGDNCNQCPDRTDAPWSLDATERRTKCCLNYIILGIDLDHDYLPVIIRAHGISALPVRQLITQLKTNRALRGEYHRAVVNIKTQTKNTRYGIAYGLHPKVVEYITDEAKAEELRAESIRLLGASIPLPEGRPEEEREPVAFTPEGEAVYSEEEKGKLLAEVAISPDTSATPTTTPTPAIQEPETEKTANGKELDFDF